MMVKENDELRNSKFSSQTLHKYPKKFQVCPRQTHLQAGLKLLKIKFQLAEFGTLKSQAQRVSTLRVRTLTQKEWDPANRMGTCGKTLMKPGTCSP